MTIKTQERHRETPLSERTIPTALADIQRRFEQLLGEDGDIRTGDADVTDADLEDTGYNPYDHTG